ncbi:hypothetical protein BHE74_00013978 [Ensete ventricosum]|nr:hypothetical protein BHE74_00013978 [Ensete ventricosum]
MPSPVDAKSLRDLEVMKSYYDIASIITEESLRLIRERYSILEEYALRAPSPNQGVVHSTLAKELYILPSEVLIAEAAKQIALGHHYQMALLDRVHDVGLVTIMGNRASHLEVEIKKLKSEGDLEQLAAAHQRVVELQANNAKIMSELGKATQRLD